VKSKGKSCQRKAILQLIDCDGIVDARGVFAGQKGARQQREEGKIMNAFKHSIAASDSEEEEELLIHATTYKPYNGPVSPEGKPVSFLKSKPFNGSASLISAPQYSTPKDRYTASSLARAETAPPRSLGRGSCLLTSPLGLGRGQYLMSPTGLLSHSNEKSPEGGRGRALKMLLADR
jgi:hypothetical protein